MELKIIKEESGTCSDHLLKNIPDEAWEEFRRLATLNGLTLGKMFEVLVTVVNKG